MLYYYYFPILNLKFFILPPIHFTCNPIPNPLPFEPDLNSTPLPFESDLKNIRFNTSLRFMRHFYPNNNIFETTFEVG